MQSTRTLLSLTRSLVVAKPSSRCSTIAYSHISPCSTTSRMHQSPTLAPHSPKHSSPVTASPERCTASEGNSPITKRRKLNQSPVAVHAVPQQASAAAKPPASRPGQGSKQASKQTAKPAGTGTATPEDKDGMWLIVGLGGYWWYGSMV